MLATDLDGTLVGDDAALLKLNELLENLINAENLKLVYVTGRSQQHFEELRREKGLLEPHALVTAVGTEIYINGKRLALWPDINSWDKKVVSNLLSKFDELEKQPDSEQRDYKISYYYEGTLDLIYEIQQALGWQYDVTYSGNKYLDILPAGINKGSAIEFLCSYWQVPITSVVACGDSENDTAMLDRYKAVAVGNANDKLLEWCKTSKNPEIYLARSGYAKGIIEGLKHFGTLN
ncbi:MAG: HAD-IIB family hydrolase [Candidatus Saccharimonadales bacterium]